VSVRVLVRPPTESFRFALSDHVERDRIDPQRAMEQHRTFVEALRAVGVDVVSLPPKPDLPDAPFVSDAVVALPQPGHTGGPGSLLVVARPGAESRRQEVCSVATAARELMPASAKVVEIEEPGTLEGGDVLVFGDRIAVGLSARTNREGARQLARAAQSIGYQVFLCPIQDRLHLATAVSVIGPSRLVGTEAGFASLVMAVSGGEIERLIVPDDELPAANVLALGGRCFVASGHPHAVEVLAAAPETVIEIPLDEFTKADGGPTCLVAIIR